MATEVSAIADVRGRVATAAKTGAGGNTGGLTTSSASNLCCSAAMSARSCCTSDASLVLAEGDLELLLSTLTVLAVWVLLCAGAAAAAAWPPTLPTWRARCRLGSGAEAEVSRCRCSLSARAALLSAFALCPAMTPSLYLLCWSYASL